MATGEVKLTVCHPEAVSFANVAVARLVPLLDHRLPI